MKKVDFKELNSGDKFYSEGAWGELMQCEKITKRLAKVKLPNGMFRVLEFEEIVKVLIDG